MTSPNGLGILAAAMPKLNLSPWLGATEEERRSVKWLLSLYTSEFFFFFHIPLFVELPAGIREPPSASDETLFSRLGRIAYIRNGRHYPKPWFQLVIFILRSGLNLACLIFLFYDLRHSKIWEGSKLHEIGKIFTGFYSTIGWYCFLASLGLYIISYLHQRYHLTREASSNPGFVEIPIKLYWLSHLSIINFSLDFPGASVPSVRVSRAIICLINIIAVIVVVFTVLFEERFIEAWDCYPAGTPYADHQYGLCPMYLGRTVSPVCDQPGIRCGRERLMAHTEFQSSLSLAHMFLTVSFAIYIISITTKITYWRTLLEESALDAKKVQ